MTDENLLKDELFSKLEEALSDKQLPTQFGARLKSTVRQMRRRWLIKVVLVSVIFCSFSLATIDFIKAHRGLSPEKTQLVAPKTPTESNPQLSKLAFLGFFRECFKRVKTNKRKEDE